jgi:hypothetical protein
MQELLAAVLVVHDSAIFFKGESFPISGHLFAASSERFKRLFQSSKGTINIQTTVNRDVVVQFIDACQMRKYSLMAANAHGLLLISRELEVSALEDVVTRFISSPDNEQSLLIPWIQFLFEYDGDTATLKCKLRENFAKFIKDEILLNLPIAILRRVVNLECDVHRIFEFLLRCLVRIGPQASILFRDFELNNLRPTELE